MFLPVCLPGSSNVGILRTERIQTEIWHQFLVFSASINVNIIFILQKRASWVVWEMLGFTVSCQ